MFLDKYLTEYDDTLSGEINIDPLGTLVIWSAYGQKIFSNRVNSISNDVRNYTLNLFNHHLIRQIDGDDSIQLSKRLSNLYGSKNALTFKYSCLVYLENLFVYSILKHDHKPSIDSGGVLGITKARRTWSETGGNPTLSFSHDAKEQLLVRQLSLGVSGRYKTPFVEIGYFDGYYHYDLPRATDLWSRTEKFIHCSKSLSKSNKLIADHLRELLAQNADVPQMSFEAISPEIHSTLSTTFASSGSVGKYARQYWLESTGLDFGAAGALLKVLDANASKKVPDALDAQSLIHRTEREGLHADAVEKFENIELLEPFLADIALLFFLSICKKSQEIGEVVKQWTVFNRDNKTLVNGALRVQEKMAVLQVLTGTAKSRLSKLLQLSSQTTVEAQIQHILDYHKQVMLNRGQVSWVKVESNGTLKVNVRPSKMPVPEDWPVGCWYNNYYIPQFMSLVDGYQGGVQ